VSSLQPALRTMLDSIFVYMKAYYDMDLRPYASEPFTGKDFINSPEKWDIYLHVAGFAPGVSWL
jgi:hypothetical protein